jgi:hypothetical protein
VTCSDANQNAPFMLVGTGQNGSKMTFTPNDQFSKVYATKDGSKVNVVKIPKSVIGFVPIGQYTMRETIAHMPLVSTYFYYVWYCCTYITYTYYLHIMHQISTTPIAIHGVQFIVIQCRPTQYYGTLRCVL